MENRFKLRISRMFRGSFGTCRPRSMSDVMISDVMEKPVFVAHNHHRTFQMTEPLSPKPRPFPSMCRPRCPERCEMIEHSCIAAEKVLPRRKVSERYPVFGCGDAEGRKCPPASPASPLNAFYNVRKFGPKDKKSKKKKAQVKKKKKKKAKARENDFNYMFSTSSADTTGGFAAGGWFSSDDDEREDETETLFSSRSLSSDSSGSQKRRLRRRNLRSRRRGGISITDKGFCRQETKVLPLEGKVKDSFAVVKKSSDPYSDFRTSMVEMIVEKQIFAAKDLEQLLQCFLSLNSSHHHRIIIEVFTEIWEALFSNWS